MEKFKRIFLSSIIILLLIIVSSCAAGAPGGNKDEAQGPSDGIPYYQYKTFVYNEETYLIYRPETVDFIDGGINKYTPTLKYYYTEYQKVDASLWTINYYQDIKRFMSLDSTDKGLIECFYTNIKNSLLEYDALLNFDLEIYESIDDAEKEFVVDMQNTFTSVLVIDVYIPYQLVNQKTHQTYDFNVPVKSFLAYRNNDKLKVVCDDLIFEINYSEFISLSNTIKI